MIYKKGEILKGNTAELIIAALILLAIIGFAYKAYTIYANQFPQQAKEMNRVIKAKINAINEGEKIKFTLPGLCIDPGKKEGCEEGYFVAGWSVSNDKRPEKCSLKSCICICGPAGNLDKADIIAICQDKRTGFCELYNEREIKVLGETSVFIPGGEGGGENIEADVNYIPLKSNLMEFNVEKSKGEIILGIE